MNDKSGERERERRSQLAVVHDCNDDWLHHQSESLDESKRVMAIGSIGHQNQQSTNCELLIFAFCTKCFNVYLCVCMSHDLSSFGVLLIRPLPFLLPHSQSFLIFVQLTDACLKSLTRSHELWPNQFITRTQPKATVHFLGNRTANRCLQPKEWDWWERGPWSGI